MSTPAISLLYRQILKAAKQFPSRKRAAMIEDIRSEFRAPVKDDTEVGDCTAAMWYSVFFNARMPPFCSCRSGVRRPSADWPSCRSMWASMRRPRGRPSCFSRAHYAASSRIRTGPSLRRPLRVRSSW